MQFQNYLFGLVSYQPAASPSIFDDLALGILNSKLSNASETSTKCVSGQIQVNITATNVNLLLPELANQTLVTELVQELFQVNSTLVTKSNGGSTTIRGVYNIDATLCFPKDPAMAQRLNTVQVLTHGVGLDKSYWDIAPGYSYVSAAADAGYATLAYNRLGVGQSDHPDPIQILQSTGDVEILHEIVGLLRAGHIGPKQFKNVIGVGHSYGSIIQLAQTAKYPKDVDAAVLTAFVNEKAYFPTTVIANNPALANQNEPTRFEGLPNGYLVHDTTASVQLPFFRFPYFSQEIFEKQYAAKSTYSFAQLLTILSIFTSAPAFQGPVDIVVGQHDIPVCFGDCTYPTDQAALTIPKLYPAASTGSQSYIVPNNGHNINAHYSASQAFSQINEFLKRNGF